MFEEYEKEPLEEYDKAIIVDDEYMGKIMEVLFDIKSKKIISSINGKKIIQLSNGKNAVNMYNKNKIYVVNLDGTNFTSIMGTYGSQYIYKNSKLGIDYKFGEIILKNNVYKKTCYKKIRNLEQRAKYLDCNNSSYIIYCTQNIEGEDSTDLTVYDENLVTFNDEQLKAFAEELIKEEEREKENNEEQNIIEEKKLPSRIEDFDFEPYEEVQQDLSDMDDIDEICEAISQRRRNR